MRPRISHREAAGAEERMRSLDGRQNAFVSRALGECVQGFRIGCRLVSHSAAFHEVRMLRTDTGIIQARGHRMCFAHLAEGVLQNQRVAALQDAGCAESQRCGVVAQSRAAAAGFHAE